MPCRKWLLVLTLVLIPVLGLVGCGDDDVTSTVVSEPGDVWTARSAGTSNYLIDVAWNGARFTAVGENGLVLTSLTGETWSQRATPDSGFL